MHDRSSPPRQPFPGDGHDLAVPRPLRHELVRPGLLARLEAAQDVRLVVLAAPSGFGKTTLLAQYARSCLSGSVGRPVAWLNLRADDAEPTVLAARIVRAIVAAVPTVGFERARQTSLSRPDRLAETLAADLNEADVSLSVVIDRAERLGSQAGEWLEFLLDALDEGHRLLLGGFEVAVRAARYVSGGSALLLGPSDLAFDYTEAAAYLQARGFGGDPAATWQALEGWPAGLSLVAAGATPGSAPADLVLEMLEHLPPDLRRSLAEVSVLETWSEVHAAAIGLQLPAGWLKAARSAGLGLTPLTAGVFRPHRLLREALQAELRESPGHYALLHEQAARRAEAAGEPLEALGHYREAGLRDEALRLVLRLVARFTSRGEHSLVRQVLEPLWIGEPALQGPGFQALPPTLERHLAVALCETGEPGRGEAMLHALRVSGQADARAVLMLGELERRRCHPQEALALFEAAARMAEDEFTAVKAATMQATALATLGRYEESWDRARGAAERATRAGDRGGLGGALFLQAVAHLGLGHWSQARALLERAVELLESLDLPGPALEARNDLARCLLYRGEFQRALSLLRHAARYAETARSNFLPVLQATRADVHLWQGEYAEAARCFRAALDGCARFGLEFPVGGISARLAEAAHRAGDEVGAHEALNRARITSSSPKQRALLAFQEGLVAWSGGDVVTARARFSEALSPESIPAVRAKLFLAELDRMEGRLQQETLAAVIAQLDELGSDTLLGLDADALTGLYAEIERRGWWPGRFTRFVPPAPPVSTPRPRLEVLTLGHLEVRMGERPVRLPFARCGELLVWLALHGPAPRDRIVDALWEGEPGHLEYFRVVVRRLRMALAEPGGPSFNPVPFHGGVYRLAEQFELSMDATGLESALIPGNPDRLRAALKTYGGEFLPGVESEWAGLVRTRLLDTALAVALALGVALEDTDPTGALAAYSRAVELDPLLDAGHLGLIRVFTTMGDHVSANHARRVHVRALKSGFPGGDFTDPRRNSGLD